MRTMAEFDDEHDRIQIFFVNFIEIILLMNWCVSCTF